MREVKKMGFGHSEEKYITCLWMIRKIFMQKVAYELYLEKRDKISVSEMGEETEVLGSW